MKFLLLLTAAMLIAATARTEVLVKIDEKGNKVFYNIPSKQIKKAIESGPALKYSKRAGDYTSLIESACKKHNVDPELVKAVIQIESAYNSSAKSPAGAIGLMQLMPGTAQRFGVEQIYDPDQNIHGGVQYLKFLLELFNNELPLAVAAYNAGEGAVQKFKGIPRYTETQNYVRKVLTLYGKQDYAAASAPKTIYKYVNGNGVVTYTTERPKGNALNGLISLR